MTGNSPHYFPDEENPGSKLGRKARESPFMVVGKIIVLEYFENLVENFKIQSRSNCCSKLKESQSVSTRRKKKDCHDVESIHS